MYELSDSALGEGIWEPTEGEQDLPFPCFPLYPCLGSSGIGMEKDLPNPEQENQLIPSLWSLCVSGDP